MPLPDFKLDRTAFSVVSLDDPSDEPAYWQTKTPAERLQAMEWLRRINYGDEAVTAWIQRVLEIAHMGIKS